MEGEWRSFAEVTYKPYYWNNTVKKWFWISQHQTLAEALNEVKRMLKHPYYVDKHPTYLSGYVIMKIKSNPVEKVREVVVPYTDYVPE